MSADSDSIIQADEIFVGVVIQEASARLAWYVGAAEQPEGDTIPIPSWAGGGGVFVRRRAGVPLNFIEVEPARP